MNDKIITIIVYTLLAIGVLAVIAFWYYATAGIAPASFEYGGY